jgi:hypothetical protein
MICLIVLLDNPFRGEMGVSPQAFELIYSQINKIYVRYGSISAEASRQH